jgi:hypothetical protein
MAFLQQQVAPTIPDEDGECSMQVAATVRVELPCCSERTVVRIDEDHPLVCVVHR